MPRDKFIPNDLRLPRDARMIILTGPNMAGKSTVLRQIGLIVLMAQIGSFVPASAARIGVVDRIFTRVGASDNLVRGQSTFMVEMSETSAILHTATARSLVLLDEIGRGTATYDGVSIAWAVTEHLHERVGCKTVFATHYHELTQLVGTSSSHFATTTSPCARSAIRSCFCTGLQPGGADRSYGIEVGRLAGLAAVGDRAGAEILARARGRAPRRRASRRRGTRAHAGAPRINSACSARRRIRSSKSWRGLDTNAMTPLEALTVLARLVEEAKRLSSDARRRIGGSASLRLYIATRRCATSEFSYREAHGAQPTSVRRRARLIGWTPLIRLNR